MSTLLSTQRVDGDAYGYASTITDSIAVAGASKFSYDSTTGECGAAYVYSRVNGTWTYLARLLASDKTASAHFGRAIETSGNYMAIGAPDAGSGRVYIFAKTTSGNYAEQKIIVPPTMNRAQFGASLAFEDPYLIVGAPAYDGIASQTGAVFVYVRSGLSWVLQTTLFPGDAAEQDHFGYSVGLNGQTLIAGAPDKSRVVPAVSRCGAAYIFFRSASTWTQLTALTASDYAANDSFGKSVSMYNGTFVAIGAPGCDGPGLSNSGAVYTFLRSSVTWLQQQKLVSPDARSFDLLGASVSVFNDVLIATAPGKNATLTWLRNNLVWSAAESYAPTYTTSRFGGDQVVARNGFSIMSAGENQGAYVSYLPMAIVPGRVRKVFRFGDATGAIAATAVLGGCGVYPSISWTSDSTPIASNTLDAKTGLAAGSYTVTATDAVGNARSWTYVIEQNAPLTVAPGAVLDVSVYGEFTGSIGVTIVSGGTGAYSYVWTFSTGTTPFADTTSADVKTGIGAGKYTLTAYDTAGATISYEYVVNQNPLLAAYLAPTIACTSGQSNGRVQLDEFLWTFSDSMRPGRTGILGGAEIASGSAPIASEAVSSRYEGSLRLGAFDGRAGVRGLSTQWTYGFWCRNGIDDFVLQQVVRHGTTTAGIRLSGSKMSLDGSVLWNLRFNSNQGWHHYAVCCDGTSVFAFQDGFLLGTMDASRAPISGSVTIGCFGFVGLVNDFRVTNGIKYPSNFTPTLTKTGSTSFNYLCTFAIDETPMVSGGVTATRSGRAFRSHVFDRLDKSYGGSAWCSDASITLEFFASDCTLEFWSKSNPSDDLKQIATDVLLSSTSLSVKGTTFALSTPSTAWCHYAICTGGGTTTAYQNGTVLGTTGVAFDATRIVVGGSSFVGRMNDLGLTLSKKYSANFTPSVAGDPSYISKSVIVSGGSGTGYTFSWSSGAQDDTARSGLAAGTYSVIVRDSAGASVTKTVTVRASARLAVLPGAIVPVAVHGQRTGSIGTTTFTGGSGVYNYTWTGLSSDAADAKNGLAAGSYTITAVDTLGETVAYTYVLPENDALVLSAGDVRPCNYGSATGSIGSTSVVGGTGSFTASWSSSSGATAISSQSLGAKSGLLPGKYTVLAVDSAGATVSYTYTIAQLQPIAIAPGAVTNILINGASTGSIGSTTASGGDGTYTVQWTPSTVSNPTTLDAKTSLSAGEYTVSVRDASSNVATYKYTITQNDALRIDGAITRVAVYGGITGAIHPLVTGGTGRFYSSWSSDATPIASSDLSAKTSLAAGNYTLRVVDTAGVSASNTFTVTQNPLLTLTPGAAHDATRFGTANGYVDNYVVSGGDGNISVEWQGLAVNSGPFNNLAAGSYTLTAHDGSGAYTSYVYTISQPDLFRLILGNASPASSGANGSFEAITTAGGTGVIASVVWISSIGATNLSSKTNLTAQTGLLPGVYTCFASDTSGSVASDAYTVTNRPAVVITPGAITSVSINGQSTGAIAASAISGGSGTFTYSWTKDGTVMDATSTSLTHLSAGTYVLSVVDSFGTRQSASFVVTQNDTLVLVPGAVTNVAIHGDDTGAIGATSVSGGDGHYTITWQGITGKTNLLAESGLVAANYVVRVVDGAGAIVEYVYVVTESDALQILPGTVRNVKRPASNGFISGTTILGGVPPYAVAWEPSLAATADEKSNLEEGDYRIVITDSVGAEDSYTYHIEAYDALVLSAGSVTNVAVYGNFSGTIGETLVSGGDGHNTINWTGPVALSNTVAEKTGLCAGVYSVTVSDGSGETVSVMYTITQNAQLQIEPGTITPVQSIGGSDGSIGASALSGGYGAYRIAWISGIGGITLSSGNTPKTGLTAATYTIVVTDSVGAIASHDFVVDESSPIVITKGDVHDSIIHSEALGWIEKSNVKGGSGSFSYSWSSDGASTDVSAITTQGPLTRLMAGTYVLKVTDTKGTSETVTFVVGEALPLQIIPGNVTNVDVYGMNTGSITTSDVIGGMPNGTFLFKWNDASLQTLGAKRDLRHGVYALTVICKESGEVARHSYYVSTNAKLSIAPGAVGRVNVFGQATGFIRPSNILGGLAPYTIMWKWSKGATVVSANDLNSKTELAAGVYTLQVTDAKGAVTQYAYDVHQNTPLVLSPGPVTDVAIAGRATGAIGLCRIRGGGGSYAFSWTSSGLGATDVSGIVSPSLSGLTPGKYLLHTIDQFAATLTTEFTVSLLQQTV